MGQSVCEVCGAAGTGTEFCDACGAFIAWDGKSVAGTADPVVAAGSVPPLIGGSTAAGTSRTTTAGVDRWDRGNTAAEPATVSSGGPTEPAAVASADDRESPGAIEPSELPCPRCGRTNPSTLRFCSRCALPFTGPVFDGPSDIPAVQPERVPWWYRLFRGRTTTRRAARIAYRRSLPLRYRLQRWLWGIIGVGVVGAGLAVLGHNPVGWVGDRWADLRGNLAQVQPLRAVSEPAAAAKPADSAASNIVDGRDDTAWTVPWSEAIASDSATGTCRPPASRSPSGATGSVLILPESAVTIRGVAVLPGLPEQNPLRLRQWRPKTLQLSFSDGSCQQIVLSDAAGLQKLPVDPVATTQVRVSVLDGYPPGPDQPIDQVAISELQLFSRP